jgi:predicted MFS family arabinose efflux permease
MAAATGSGKSYWPLVPAVATNVTVVTTIGFLAPLLVVLAHDFSVSTAEAGQLVLATALPWGLLAPFSGLLGDRFGRRPVIILALSGMGLATIFGSFATDLRMLLALRLLAGACGSGGPPSIMAGLLEYYPAHQRGRVIGWLNTSFSIAALIAVPALSALGGLLGWRASFQVVGTMLLLGAVAIWLTYPRLTAGSSGSANPLQAYRYLFGRPHLLTLLLANLAERVTYSTFTVFMPALLIQSYGLDLVSIAPALAVIAIGALAGTVAGGQFADRFDRLRMALTTLVVSGLCGLALYVWPLHLAFSVLIGCCFGLANSAGRPPFTAMLLGLTERHRGAINGLFALTNQMGSAFGAGFGGAMLAWAGYSGLGPLALGFAILASALILSARTATRPSLTHS